MSRWYINQKGKAHGPFTTEEVMSQIEKVQISPLDYIFKTGDSEWKLAQEHEEFKGLLKSPSVLSPNKSESQNWVVLKRQSDGQERKFLQQGPYSEAVVKDLLLTGEISYFDFIWTRGYASWKRIGEVTEFLSTDLDHTHLIEKSQDAEVTIEIDQPMRASSAKEDSHTSLLQDQTQVINRDEESVRTLELKIQPMSEPPPAGVKTSSVVEKGTATFLFEQSDYEDSRFSFDPEENNRLMRMPRPDTILPPSTESELENEPTKDSLKLNLATSVKMEETIAPGTEDLLNRSRAIDLALISQSQNLKSKPLTAPAIKKRGEHGERWALGLVLLASAGLVYFIAARNSANSGFLNRFNWGASINHALKTEGIQPNAKVGIEPKLKPLVQKKPVNQSKQMSQAVVQAFDRVKGEQRPIELQKQIAIQTGEIEPTPTQEIRMPVHHEVVVQNKEVVEPKRMAEPNRKRKPASQQLLVSQTRNRSLDISVPALNGDWVIVTIDSVEKKIEERASAHLVMRKKTKDDYVLSFDVSEKMAPNGAYRVTVKYGSEEISKSIKFGVMDSNHSRKLRRDLKKNSYYFIRDKKWCIYGSRLLSDFLVKLRNANDGASLSAEWKKIKLFKLPKLLTKRSNRIDTEMGYPQSIETIREVIEMTDVLLKKPNTPEIEKQMGRLEGMVSRLKEDSIF